MGETSNSHFLSLPLEIRDIIYGHLLPNDDDVSLAMSYRNIANHKGRRERIFRPRKDEDICHPEILRVNKQIYSEASSILYARTYTITICADNLNFLDSHYQYKLLFYKNPRLVDRGMYLDVRTSFPTFLPFHRFKALRIQISAPQRDRVCAYDSIYPWSRLLEELEDLSHVLSRTTNRGQPLKMLLIDAWELCAYHGPQIGDHATIAKLRLVFGAFRDSIGDVESCEIRVGTRAGTDPETIRIAKDCGRAIVLQGPPNGPSFGNSLTSSKISASYSKKDFKPALSRMDLKNGADPETIYVDWRLRYTRL